MEPLDHLFRHESGRMVAALTRIFGVHNLALAEDVAQDALCRALEVWRIQGLPDNPAAWLMGTAKRRALDVLRRERTARTYAPEVAYAIETNHDLAPALEVMLGAANMRDDELRMMFSCCHPHLAEPVRVALILHILCGFSVGEIAAAFLSSEEATKKRISRGKAVLANSRRLFDLKRGDLAERLSSVHRALYLLFNEGYHGASPEYAVRKELCDEAMRLGTMLCDNSMTAVPATYALLALMCLHSARLPARVDAAGDFTMLLDQDRSRWDEELINDGQRLMDLSARGTVLTAYHVEAAIASVHAEARFPVETRWATIVELYDALMQIQPSPVVALNRALAIAQRDGPQRGLDEIAQISDSKRLAGYPFYSAALAELHLRTGDVTLARDCFITALGLARSQMERRLLERRLAECETSGGALHGAAHELEMTSRLLGRPNAHKAPVRKGFRQFSKSVRTFSRALQQSRGRCNASARFGVIVARSSNRAKVGVMKRNQMTIARKKLQLAALVPCLLYALQAVASNASPSTLQNECALETRDVRTVVTNLGSVPAVLRIPPHVSMSPIVLWHGFGVPANEAELMARFPLDDVPAIKVYLGLPLFGRRAPAGGTDDLLRRQKKDVGLLIFEPVVWGAVNELPSVTRMLERHGCMKAGERISLFGFSAGGAAALISLAEHRVKVDAAVVLNASTGLSASIHAFEHATGLAYVWTDASRMLAKRSDSSDRAIDMARDSHPPALLTISGGEDSTITPEDLIRFRNSMTARYAEVGAPDRFQSVVIEGLSHNLGDSTAERELQQRVAAWFNRFHR